MSLGRTNAPALLAGVLLAALAAALIGAPSSGAGPGALDDRDVRPGASAHTSRVESFEESLRMRITLRKEKRVDARGKATGTVSGKVSFKLILENGTDASFTFFGHNANGTLSGAGAARYRVNGAISSYTGKITKLKGTGRYARASSRGIGFSGIVNRRTYKVRLSLSGRWHV